MSIRVKDAASDRWQACPRGWQDKRLVSCNSPLIIFLQEPQHIDKAAILLFWALKPYSN